MKISILTSFYNSQPLIPEFFHRTYKVVSEYFENVEFVIVDDGSRDQSVEIAIDVAKEFPDVKILRLSKNFGQHRAIFSGLEQTTGDYVFILDCDLEEPPEEFHRLWRQLQKSDADYIYGTQDKRDGGLFRKITSWCFYRIFNSFSEVKVPNDSCFIRILPRYFVDALLSIGDREPSFIALSSIVGFKGEGLKIEKTYKGDSSYSFSKRLKVALNFFLSFSDAPLYLLFVSGSFVAFISLSFLGVVLFEKFFYATSPGWASLFASIWLIGGLILASIGIVGLYIRKIYREILDRPSTFVSELQHVGKSVNNSAKNLSRVSNESRVRVYYKSEDKGL